MFFLFLIARPTVDDMLNLSHHFEDSNTINPVEFVSIGQQQQQQPTPAAAKNPATTKIPESELYQRLDGAGAINVGGQKWKG